MSSTYNAVFDQELPKVAGIQPDDLIIYTGPIQDNKLDGPTSSTRPSKCAYVLRWRGDHAEELDVDFVQEDNGSYVLNIPPDGDLQGYLFLYNKARTCLYQVSGPQMKPIVIGNIGAGAIRVDTDWNFTPSSYIVPAGTLVRLDENAHSQCEELSNILHPVLLTFCADRRRGGSPIESAMLEIERGRWKPLNICVSDNIIQIKDGPFVVQTLTYDPYTSTVTLNDPPWLSIYTIWLRCLGSCPNLRGSRAAMKDEGMVEEYHDFHLEPNVIYGFDELRHSMCSIHERQFSIPQECLAGIDDFTDTEDVPWPDAPEKP